jgi:hypothetical protein
MNDLYLTCEGITVGGIGIPAFELRRGDFICLHMPCLCDSKEANLVVQALTGKEQVSGLQADGVVAQACPARGRAGLVGLFYHPRAVNWLRRTARIPLATAQATVARLGIGTEGRVPRLDWLSRNMLGLEAAWLSGADVVIFTTVGLDPLGRNTTFEAVAAHLGRSAAIHLSYTYWSHGLQERQCFPGTCCLELTQSASASASLSAP